MSRMSQKMTRRSFAALAVAVPGVATLYACTPGEPAPPAPTANVAFTQRQTGAAPTATTAPVEAGAAATEFNVSMVDLDFVPADFTIPADTDVTVTASNDGALPHNWHVLDTEMMTPVVDGGGVESVVVNLPAGVYNVQCDVPGHAAAGMVGVLTVADAGAVAEAAPVDLPPVALEGGDLYFEPTMLTAEVGQTLALSNVGVLPHNFAIEGYNDDAPVDMPNGETVDWMIPADLVPGVYVFYCEIPGHREAMNGIITILATGSTVPPAAAAGTPEAAATPAGGTPESGTPEGTPVATTGEAPAATGGATAITISMVDLKFVPADVTIPANTDVTVTVSNDGVLEHNWDVIGTAFKTPIVGGGTVEAVTVNLAAGSYDIQCDVPGHAAAGMVGKLTVQ